MRSGNYRLKVSLPTIRDNIALALTHATGGWVSRYIIEARGREEKSFRCRFGADVTAATREANAVGGSRCWEILPGSTLRPLTG